MGGINRFFFTFPFGGNYLYDFRNHLSRSFYQYGIANFYTETRNLIKKVGTWLGAVDKVLDRLKLLV